MRTGFVHIWFDESDRRAVLEPSRLLPLIEESYKKEIVAFANETVRAV